MTASLYQRGSLMGVMSNPKSQAPNPNHSQIPTTPKSQPLPNPTHSQIPTTPKSQPLPNPNSQPLQVPNPKHSRISGHSRLTPFGIWQLGVVGSWSLELGI